MLSCYTWAYARTTRSTRTNGEQSGRPNQAGPSPTKPTIQPGWIGLEEVEHMFMEAGLTRTRNLLGRYCRNGRLIGAKDADRPVIDGMSTRPLSP